MEYAVGNFKLTCSAETQLNRIEKMILSLEEMPERFRRYDKEPWYSQGLRIVPVDNYLVVYIPELVTRRVTIIRVLHGKRNIDGALNSHTNMTTE